MILFVQKPCLNQDYIVPRKTGSLYCVLRAQAEVNFRSTNGVL